MTRFFMCSLALLLFCSCMETRIEYVAKKSDVLQKAYAADKPLLDSFAKHLLAIKELQDDLKVKMDTVVADSLDLGVILEKVMLDEVPFTGKLTAANFLSVHNTGNIRQYFMGQGNATYNFGLSMLDTVVDDVTTDAPLSLWTAHLGGDNEGEYKDNDSLSTYGLKDYNAKLAREKEQIKNVKYLVCIHDKLLVQPKAIDNKSFEEGVIVTHIKIYDAATGEKVGQKVLMATNTDEVKNSFGAAHAVVIDQILIANLHAQRDKGIKEYIGLTKNKEAKKPVSK